MEKMYKGNLPFDDVSPSKQKNKEIPRGFEAFSEYVDYLASSPNIDPGYVSSHILQFLVVPKVKPEVKKSVLLALGSMEMPPDFWSALFSKFQQQFNPKWEFAEAMLVALTAAPVSVILQQYNKFTFLTPFLSAPTQEVRYAAFAALYKFRDHILITPDIVDAIIANISAKLPKLVFIIINWLMFLISVDYPQINELLKPHHDNLLHVITVFGHLMNEKQLAFLIEYTQPSLHQLISMSIHLSIPSACFVLSYLPSCPDFPLVADMALSCILPLYNDLIRNPMSDGMKNELIIAALEVIRRNKNATNNKIYFDSLVALMFSLPGLDDFKLLSLVVNVANIFNALPSLISKAATDAKSPNVFPKLISISCVLAEEKNLDIVSEILKLFTWQTRDENWRLAAATALQYLYTKHEFTTQHFQELFNVMQSLSEPIIRATMIIILAYYVPVNLRAALVEEARNMLFPNYFVPYHSTYDIKKIEHRETLPTVLRVSLVRILTNLAQGDELEEIEEELKSPLLAPFIKAPMTTDVIPVNPFSFCTNSSIGMLAAALEFPSTNVSSNFLGVTRQFTTVSPSSHALCIEIASNVVGKHKSVSLDVRVSVKQLTPSLSIYFDLPPDFTPPHVEDWHITDLDRGSKVTRRITFTANKMSNPFMNIRAEMEGQVVMNLKVVIPLIDLFDKVDPNSAVSKHLWSLMKCEKKNIPLPDSMWVCWNGCVIVKDGVARADEESYLDMLPSAFNTTAVKH